MANYLTTDTELTATANAIRSKAGTSGTIQYKSNTGFADAVSAIPAGGNTVANANFTKITNKTSYQATNAKVTIPSAGTWKISWTAFASSSNSSFGTQLYKGTSAVGSSHQPLQYNSGSIVPFTETLTLAANDVITVYAKTRSGSSYYTCVFDIIAEKQ